MAEAQRADQQAGNNLVANAKHRNTFEHTMAKPHRRCHRDYVAAEQGQFHRILPLCHAIAHGRCGTGHLRGCANLPCKNLHLLWVTAIRLMRGQHVVIGADDANIHSLAIPDRRLVRTTGGKAMRQVTAA